MELGVRWQPAFPPRVMVDDYKDGYPTDLLYTHRMVGPALHPPHPSFQDEP